MTSAFRFFFFFFFLFFSFHLYFSLVYFFSVFFYHSLCFFHVLFSFFIFLFSLILSTLLLSMLLYFSSCLCYLRSPFVFVCLIPSCLCVCYVNKSTDEWTKRKGRIKREEKKRTANRIYTKPRWRVRDTGFSLGLHYHTKLFIPSLILTILWFLSPLYDLNALCRCIIEKRVFFCEDLFP